MDMDSQQTEVFGKVPIWLILYFLHMALLRSNKQLGDGTQNFLDH